MKVIYTGEAIDSLEGILAFIATNYPAKFAAFEKRLRTAVMRIGAWPESAEEVAERAETSPGGLLDDVPLALPGLTRAVKLQTTASSVIGWIHSE